MTDTIALYLWAGTIVFIRAGAILMLSPGIGENSVPARFRLVVALLTAMAAAPALRPVLPAQPADLASLLEILFAEVLVGLLIGTCGRILMGAAHVMGQIGALQSGLAFAQFFDPANGVPNATLGVFAGITALAVVMAGDFHHMFLMAAAQSYTRFPAGEMPVFGDGLELVVSAVSTMFRLGMQMSAPLLVFGLVFNAALAILSRLAPQIQVFFIGIGPSIELSLFIFMASLGSAMMVFADGLETFFRGFL